MAMAVWRALLAVLLKSTGTSMLRIGSGFMIKDFSVISYQSKARHIQAG
jgi:hypothetical protein